MILSDVNPTIRLIATSTREPLPPNLPPHVWSVDVSTWRDPEGQKRLINEWPWESVVQEFMLADPRVDLAIRGIIQSVIDHVGKAQIEAIPPITILIADYHGFYIAPTVVSILEERLRALNDPPFHLMTITSEYPLLLGESDPNVIDADDITIMRD